MRDYYMTDETNSPKGSRCRCARCLRELTESHFAANDSRMLLRVDYGRHGYHPVEHWAPEVRA